MEKIFNYQAIKDLREFLGMYQREFAEALNVTNTTVCHWEKGDHNPELGNLISMYNLGIEHDFDCQFFLSVPK